MSFADALSWAMPDGIELEPEIVAAVDWMESSGYVQSNDRRQYAELFAPWERAGDRWARGCLLAPMESDWARSWLGTDDHPGLDRVGYFVQTGGDGSNAGVWLDDDGHQRYVHFGSGSGSLWFGMIADNPVDFLRFLAMGYQPDACWTDLLHLTPQDAWVQAESPHSYIKPTALQDWVSTTYDVAIPTTAADLIPLLPTQEFEANPDDPFSRWLDSVL